MNSLNNDIDSATSNSIKNIHTGDESSYLSEYPRKESHTSEKPIENAKQGISQSNNIGRTAWDLFSEFKEKIKAYHFLFVVLVLIILFDFYQSSINQNLNNCNDISLSLIRIGIYSSIVFVVYLIYILVQILFNKGNK